MSKCFAASNNRFRTTLPAVPPPLAKKFSVDLPEFRISGLWKLHAMTGKLPQTLYVGVSLVPLLAGDTPTEPTSPTYARVPCRPDLGSCTLTFPGFHQWFIANAAVDGEVYYVSPWYLEDLNEVTLSWPLLTLLD